MVIKKRMGKKEIVIDYSKTTSNLADGKEAANNVKSKREDDVNESKDERDKIDKEVGNESEDSTDELAEAAAEGDVDDDAEQDLDVRHDGEQDAECGDDDLEIIKLEKDSGKLY